MGKASRQKRERREKRRRRLFGIKPDVAPTFIEDRLGKAILDELNACSIIASQSMREAREESIEKGFLNAMSCQCRPPCGAPVEVPSMFGRGNVTLIPCKIGLVSS